MATDIITVKSNLKPIPGKTRRDAPENLLALYERHPDHPNEEIMVVGDREVEVARTPKVHAALANETIVQVTNPKKKKDRRGKSVKAQKAPEAPPAEEPDTDEDESPDAESEGEVSETEGENGSDPAATPKRGRPTKPKTEASK